MRGLRYMLAGAAIASLATPTLASAQGANINAQIQALMQQIAMLQTQISTRTTTAPAVTTQSVPSTACPQFTRTLTVGTSGQDVFLLQSFLARTVNTTNSHSLTGTFDLATQRDVQAFQTRYNIVSGGTPETTGFGAVGPRTQRLVSLNCASAASIQSVPNAPVATGLNACLPAPRPSTTCPGSWQANSDANGCTISWQCSVPLQTLVPTTVPAATQTQTVPSNCAYYPRPTTDCSGAWRALTDYKGCTQAWQCL